ncbi:MAG: glycerol-3-phosphate dehydrogenase/oxidase [Cyclobacteriaceae bacterium]|nr:glycerol-3-phosphate dehydrogenase/oxidase [Cyclobacteriaceae bacterium]
MPFSVLDRPHYLRQLQQEMFDVLIIGGGITGVGIALDAASRGLRVALAEQHDFAFGTSSRSTKLIHGGLRYLKQLEFALVKEVGSERAVVHALAPHLVVPEKMLLPLYEKRGLGYWITSAGLKIYDLLAGVKREDQRKMLTRQVTLLQEPLLKPQDVKGGALYAEYRTDDARLTIEIAKRAVKEGAILVNYATVTDFLSSQGQVSGARVRDGESSETIDVRARVVVNAAGPWVDELRTKNNSLRGKTLHLTKGVHIVVPYHRLPVRQAIYFDVPDGRMIFAIPRGRTSYIGTTDTDYQGDKNDVRATLEDVRYLIQAVNETFPSVHLTVADVESSWAGLRPLIHEEGKSASELSRKDEIFESESGLISIAGGKLTGYRKMAERVVDRIVENLPDTSTSPCRTASLRLAESNLANAGEVNDFTARIADRAERLGLKGAAGTYLVHLYGQQADGILSLAESQASDDPEFKLTLAELAFALAEESVVHAEDFLVRRTGWLFFDIHRLMRSKDMVIEAMSKSLGWSPDRREEEMRRVERWIERSTRFEESEKKDETR